MKQGVFIDVEGIDGSGKQTQSRLLADHLRATGASVATIEFPRYASTFFGREVGNFLNGAFGELGAVDPKLAALLYAGDRYESRTIVAEHLERNRFLICDRYTPSNQAHNAAKLPVEKRRAFFEWVEELEYGVYVIPKPDVVVFLDVDPDVSADLILRKKARDYTDRAADIHEADLSYQREVYGCYRELSRSANWITVDCNANGGVADPLDIHRALVRRLADAGFCEPGNTA